MAGFTPGPWLSVIVDEGGAAKAKIRRDSSTPAMAMVYRTWQPEGLANASLIAAAPEMFEALSVIVINAGLIPDPATGESTDCYAVPIDDIERAIAAINKARGEA